MFTKFDIDFKTNIYDELSKSIEFENITNGRTGAVLVDCKNELIPLVRTTTCYNKPAQKFLPIHYDIIENIKKVTNDKNLEFNNALIEVYNSKYCTMGYHTDQSLDLADDSYICLFSCYDNVSPAIKRKLVIKEKANNKCSEIVLEHNSIVLFSVATNRKFLHKIILEKATNDHWLGITFRLSKTFIKFIDNIPYFYPSKINLKLATDNEKKVFSKCKGQENSQEDYQYPEINYSISSSDLMIVK
jgi:hypothetical protein